jgi:hypothetical protein
MMDHALSKLADERIRGASGKHDATGCPHSFLGALIATAATVPVFAAALTVAAYSMRPDFLPGWADPLSHPLLAAMINLVVAWLVVAGLFYGLGFTAADRANEESYNGLCDRLRVLTARCSSLGGDPGEAASSRPDESLVRCNVRVEIRGLQEGIERDLKRGGPQWVLATQYASVWKRMQLLEEALIQVAPLDVVIAGAMTDVARCSRSGIRKEDELKNAIRFLRMCQTGSHERGGPGDTWVGDRRGILAATSAMLGRSNGHDSAVPGRMTGVRLPGARVGANAAEHVVCEDDTPRTEDEARAVLRRIRRTINEYRSDRWSGLVRTRNHLMMAAGLMGLAAYILLWLVIVQQTRENTIAAGATLFVIGAIVGLFNHCYNDAGTTKTIDDYGLAYARLVASPLISGVAAIGGVVVVSLLSISHGGGGTPPAEASLADFFHAGRGPFNALVAGTFGLTPGLLIERLKQEKSEQIKSDLEMSEVGSSK